MTARPLRWALLAVVAVALAATFAAVELRRQARPAFRAEVPAVLGEVPRFELTNRDGTIVRDSDLAGEPWVADFIFTRCALSCPRLTSLMVRLGADAPDVTRVSFSVDPEHDTPRVLADYATAYGIDDSRWRFLTGSRDEIQRVVIEGFKLPIVRDPPPEALDPEEPILHSDRLVLVDGAGSIRGYYEATSREDYEKLVRDLDTLRAEGPPGGAGPSGAGALRPRMRVEACVREIEELHRFFEEWYAGSLPNSDGAFDRFADALAEGFSIIGPGGAALERQAILELVREGHGSRAGEEFSIWIENARVHECGAEHCLATYEEWQRTADATRGRLSTVLFAPRPDAPNGLEWRHVHETWLPESSGAQLE